MTTGLGKLPECSETLGMCDREVGEEEREAQ
jgi:hypothetical protein